MKNSIVKKVIYSLLLISSWIILLFIFLYPDNSGLGKTFGVVIFLIFTLFFSLAIGLIVFILRRVKLLKPNSFFFIFAGVLNLCMGVCYLILILSNLNSKTEMNYMFLFLFSFLIGLLIWVDVLQNNKNNNAFIG